MIAASKRIIARVSSIALWPLTMLAANIARLNRKIVRWAIRRRCGPAYLVAMFWVPTITVAGIVWAIAYIHQKPNVPWPALGVVLVIVKKVLALVAYILEQAKRSIKAMRLYRRVFRSARDPAVTTVRASREAE